MPDMEPTTRWNIISKARNGRYYLDHVEAKAKDTGASIFIKVQQLCLSSTKSLNWLFVLHDQVVYTATAVPVGLDSLVRVRDLILEGPNFERY